MHLLTLATGTGSERTPWRATQRAAWEALRKPTPSQEAGHCFRSFIEAPACRPRRVLCFGDTAGNSSKPRAPTLAWIALSRRVGAPELGISPISSSAGVNSASCHQLSFRKSSRASLNAAGLSAGAACRPWATTTRRDPCMQRLAVSARIRKVARVSSPFATVAGTLI